MIGHIKNQVIKAIRGTNKKWWEVVDAVVKDYNEDHVSRNTQMTPKEAEKKENQAEVKEQLESIRKTDNPQARIAEGDKVRVIIKKKFEKGYMPDWSDEVYTVQSVSKGKDNESFTHISQGPIIERQALYQLIDPNNTLNSYNKGCTCAANCCLSKRRADAFMIDYHKRIVYKEQRNHACSGCIPAGGCSSWSRSNRPISFCSK